MTPTYIHNLYGVIFQETESFINTDAKTSSITLNFHSPYPNLSLGFKVILPSHIPVHTFYKSKVNFMDTLQSNKLEDACSDVIMTVTLENAALWNVRWDSLVEIYRFRRSCYLHIKGSRLFQKVNAFLADYMVLHPKQ
jgi:hypothetical protein